MAQSYRAAGRSLLKLQRPRLCCNLGAEAYLPRSQSRLFNTNHVTPSTGRFLPLQFTASCNRGVLVRYCSSSSSSSGGRSEAISLEEDELVTKFFKAAKSNDVAAAEDLIESASFRELKESVNFTDALGNSPLMICAQRNWSDSITILLGNDHCDVNHQNMFGSSALMCSSSHGHIDALKVLLDNSKVEVDLVSRFGQTALMKAAQAGKLESIQILLAKGANVAILNKQGKGALQIAEEKEHKAVGEFLTRYLSRLAGGSDLGEHSVFIKRADSA